MSRSVHVRPAAGSTSQRGRRHRSRPLIALTVLAMIAAGLTGLVGSATPAAAATAPSPAGTTPLATAQINGVVWNQIVVGDRVFAGGEFTKARPAGAAPGVNEVTRNNLMSYKLSTGVMDSFAPIFNGTVYNMAASPDKKTLYVVGNFTKVGSTVRNRIAAFDIATGKLTSFAPTLSSKALTVLAISKGVFVGGEFTSANGVARYRAAAFSTSGGLLKWAPKVEGGSVRDMVQRPDDAYVVLGGNFTTVNGSSDGYGLALVGTVSGLGTYKMPVNSVVRNGYTANGGIWDLGRDSSGFYATGWGNSPTLEGVVHADWKGNVIWIEDCHGDSYSVYPTTDFVYTASHAHYCANTGGFGETTPMGHSRGMAFTVATRGGILSPDPTHYKNWAGTPRPTVQQFYPDIDAGTYTGQEQGAWSVTGSGGYVAYAGEFTTVNGKAQQGLVRFASRTVMKSTDGPVLPTNYQPSVKAYSDGTARVRWSSVPDRGNTSLSYQLIKNGTNLGSAISGPGYFWIQPKLGKIDTGLTSGQTYTYQVRVTDPDGNSKLSATTSFTYNAGAALQPYDKAVLADNPDFYWTGTAGDAGSTQVNEIASEQTVAYGNQDGSTTNGVMASSGRQGGDTRSFGFSGGQSFRTPTAKLAPNTFSVEAWFKSPTNSTGGAIVTSSKAAAGNSPLTTSGDDSRADRTIYLGSNGTVNFGIYARAPYTVSTDGTTNYNDNQWHHVVGTMNYAGTKLYVDGQLKASQSAVYGGANVTGYWRVGGDLLTGYPNNPTATDANRAGYFTGDIDQVSIYQRALTDAQVSAHYAAR